MIHLLHSRMVRILLAIVGLSLFYAIGVIARHHAGVCIVIRNESTQPVRELSVVVGDGGDRHSFEDLAPGDHERAFVQTVENSRVDLEFAEGGQKSRTVTVFDHAETGDCGTSTVRLLPQRSTETNEIHRSICWKGWLDFL